MTLPLCWMCCTNPIMWLSSCDYGDFLQYVVVLISSVHLAFLQSGSQSDIPLAPIKHQWSFPSIVWPFPVCMISPIPDLSSQTITHYCSPYLYPCFSPYFLSLCLLCWHIPPFLYLDYSSQPFNCLLFCSHNYMVCAYHLDSICHISCPTEFSRKKWKSSVQPLQHLTF